MRARAQLQRPGSWPARTWRPGIAACALALLTGAAGAEDPAPAPLAPAVPVEAPPLHPFVTWMHQVTPGAPIRGQGLLLVPLLRAPEEQDVVEDGRVGLHDAFVDVMDLPLPAGELYVRMTNRGTHPVEVTVGEALVTPDGPSRMVLRAAYLPPGVSAFVPTARGLAALPHGPYLSRGLGLSPREQALLGTARWPNELAARNAQFGVDPARNVDGSAAYLTEGFQIQAAAYEPRFEPLRSLRCVGVAAFDERGLAFARICGDAARFHGNLVFLERELILDALRGLAAGRLPRDQGDAFLKAEVRNVLGALETLGVARLGFAGAAHHRWEVSGKNARWEGLSAEGRPWSLTWRMAAPPLPAPPPVVQPPTPPQPPPAPPEGDPSVMEIDRKARPTPLEERLRDRRDPAGGGGGGGNPGGGGGGNNPGGGGGGGLGGGGAGGGGLGGGGGGGGLR